MLIEFSVANFRSIRDRQTLTFVATSIKEHESTHVYSSEAAGVDRLLRSAVIYGANAAGKSNLLRALDTMQDIVLLNNQVGQKIPTIPFLLDDSSAKPTEFEIVFIADSVKYQYGFICNKDEIIEEWLFAFPEKRAQRWFTRKQNSTVEGGYEWEFSSLLKGAKRSWASATRNNALFLSTAIQLNAEQLRPVFLWVQRKIRVVIGSQGIADGYSTQLLQDEEKRSQVAKLLQNADSGIQALEVIDKIPEKEFVEMVNSLVPEDVGANIIRSASKGVRAQHESSDGGKVWFNLEDESDGTRRLFAYAGPFLDVLAHGRILVIDELNNSLHPIMVKWIIDTFNDPITNIHGAQLFFVSHATSVLSLDIFRRDQIWFAEKKKDGSTCIYPLTDFSPRKESSLSKNYLQGRFGAIPFLSSNEFSL